MKQTSRTAESAKAIEDEARLSNKQYSNPRAKRTRLHHCSFDVSAQTLFDHIKQRTCKGSVYTDDFKSYKDLQYGKHSRVKHRKRLAKGITTLTALKALSFG